MNQDQNKQQQIKEQDPSRLLYVMLVTLIICGGNGLSLIAAAIIWRITGAVAVSICTAIGITLLAFLSAMLLVISHNRKKTK